MQLSALSAPEREATMHKSAYCTLRMIELNTTVLLVPSEINDTYVFSKWMCIADFHMCCVKK